MDVQLVMMVKREKKRRRSCWNVCVCVCALSAFVWKQRKKTIANYTEEPAESMAWTCIYKCIPRAWIVLHTWVRDTHRKSHATMHRGTGKLWATTAHSNGAKITKIKIRTNVEIVWNFRNCQWSWCTHTFVSVFEWQNYQIHFIVFIVLHIYAASLSLKLSCLYQFAHDECISHAIAQIGWIVCCCCFRFSSLKLIWSVANV